MVALETNPSSVLGTEDNAVPEELVGRLYRAGEQGAAEIAAAFAPHQRADLAAYCYRKAHLHAIGLAIAATCDRDTLVRALGTAFGTVLHNQARAPGRPGVRAPGPQRAAVTLARPTDAARASLVPDIDDDTDDMAEELADVAGAETPERPTYRTEPLRVVLSSDVPAWSR